MKNPILKMTSAAALLAGLSFGQGAAPANGEMQKAAKMESVRQDNTMTQNSDGKVVVGITKLQGGLEIKSPFFKMAMNQPNNPMGNYLREFENGRQAGRFGDYLRGFVGSMPRLQVADVDEERLTEAMAEIEKGELGAAGSGAERGKWLGVNAFAGGYFKYGKVKPIAVAIPNANLKVIPDNGEPFEVKGVPVQDLSAGGFSEQDLAYHMAKDLNDMISATPQERTLINDINAATIRANMTPISTALWTLLAAAEFIAVGVLCSRWEEDFKDADKNAIGFTLGKYAGFAMGGVSLVGSVANFSGHILYAGKAARLKDKFNRSYYEKYQY